MTQTTSKQEIAKAVRYWVKALAAGYSAEPTNGSATKSAVRVVHEKLGLATTNTKRTKDRLDIAVALGMDVPQWGSSLSQEQEAAIRLRYGIKEVPPAASPAATARSGKSTSVREVRDAEAPTPDRVTIQNALRRKPLTLGELAAKLGVDERIADRGISAAIDFGATIHYRSGKLHLDAEPAMGIQRSGGRLQFLTDKDGYLEFAATGDQHLCSKYERLDCLNEYYDQIENRGITVAFNTGNWIDGEATFNRHDLLVHGMDAQMQYLAKNYPQRKGVHNYAITGADHEGWYARREGVDVGRYAANVMEEAGRADWTDLGYMESYVDLVHADSGKSSKLSVMHPGGGSSYAVSYAPQKIVEGFDGGDKPAVLLIGHYHKSGYNNIRNCHTMQTGCFQDQTVFMRQKKLSAHLGGCFVKIHVDPFTGAVDECSYTFRNYFVKDYYNGRWSQHGNVTLAKRSPK